jgi:hypothetical protein
MRRNGEADAARTSSKIKAVEMVRLIREEHYAQLKDLSSEEKIAFFRKGQRIAL